MVRIALIAFALFISTGCASTTVIRSHPSGAKVRNQSGQVVGKTPYRHEDTAMVNHTEVFTIEKDGYEEEQVVIRRDELNAGRAVGFGLGGFFVWPLWIGLLWTTDYAPAYTTQLEPKADGGEEVRVARSE